MSADPSSRAADLAARQVEAIVTAAQKAADGIRAEADREAAEYRRQAELDAKRIREEARLEADVELTRARTEAERVHEEASKQVEARLAAAEQAANDALADARAMSQGLRRLGSVLGEQAERMLRDVQAAHRRLTADLRVAGTSARASSAPAARVDRPVAAAATPASPSEATTKLPAPDEAAAITELAARERAAAREGRGRGGDRPLDRAGGGDAGTARGRAAGERANPFDEIDVPSWVEPS